MIDLKAAGMTGSQNNQIAETSQPGALDVVGVTRVFSHLDLDFASKTPKASEILDLADKQVPVPLRISVPQQILREAAEAIGYHIDQDSAGITITPNPPVGDAKLRCDGDSILYAHLALSKDGTRLEISYPELLGAPDRRTFAALAAKVCEMMDVKDASVPLSERLVSLPNAPWQRQSSGPNDSQLMTVAEAKEALQGFVKQAEALIK